MKVSIRSFAISFAAATVSLCLFAAPGAHATPVSTEFALNQEAIQILKGSQMMFLQPNAVVNGNDTLNMKITFTNNDAECNGAAADIIGNGIGVKIGAGKCCDYYTKFSYTIPKFVPKTVGGVKIGTYFATNGSGTVTAKATTLPTPPGACSKWTLEFQATKVYLPSKNPIALILSDANDSTCFDIYNALIGTGF